MSSKARELAERAHDIKFKVLEQHWPELDEAIDALRDYAEECEQRAESAEQLHRLEHSENLASHGLGTPNEVATRIADLERRLAEAHELNCECLLAWPDLPDTPGSGTPAHTDPRCAALRGGGR